MNELKKFEQRFVQEEQELIVLMKSDVGGGAILGDYIKPSVHFVASVEVTTDALCEEEGRLEWMLKHDKDSADWGFDLKKISIAKVRVRKAVEREVGANELAVMKHLYQLIEVVEENVAEPRLEKIREEYVKPVVIEDSYGSFELDREYGWFEGEIDWFGESCNVMLEVDSDNDSCADKAYKVFTELMSKQAEWNQKFREYAAAELTSLANDWLADSDDYDEETTEDITEETFAKRLIPESLTVSDDGSLQMGFYDDDMFWGHWVVVNGNISGEMDDANIEG